MDTMRNQMLKKRSTGVLPTLRGPTLAAMEKLRELAQQAALSSDQLSRIWKAAQNLPTQYRDEILQLLSQNPNVSDDVFKQLMARYPASAIHNPMVPLRNLAEPNWARDTVGVTAAQAHSLVHYGHPAAMAFVGPPTHSLSFKNLHEKGGFLTGSGGRFDPPVKQIDLWVWPKGEYFGGELTHVVRFTLMDGSHLVTQGLHAPQAKELLGVAAWSLFLQSNYIKNPVAFLLGHAD